ncbi:MAG TPA: hypothetical protein VH113_11045 [Gemmatimonadales bacterium]|jgi:hypothetical protein|nr:hypothetical protein [Gemmatimonadales bacterium]
MSSTSSTDEIIRGYLAGRVRPDRVVAAVAAAYYRDRKALKGAGWRELIAVIERASPGVVELAAAEGRGFEVKLAERPFPPAFEPALKAAAQKALAETPGSISSDTTAPAPSRGFFARMVDRVLQIFG